MGVGASLRKVANTVDRLGHTSIRGGSTIKAAGRKARQLAAEAGEAIDKARAERREKKETKPLKKRYEELSEFKEETDRRALAEDLVYGRSMTATERAEFEKYQKQKAAAKAARQARVLGVFGGRSNSTRPGKLARAQIREGRRDASRAGSLLSAGSGDGVKFITGSGRSDDGSNNRSRRVGGKDFDSLMGLGGGSSSSKKRKHSYI